MTHKQLDGLTKAQRREQRISAAKARDFQPPRISEIERIRRQYNYYDSPRREAAPATGYVEINRQKIDEIVDVEYSGIQVYSGTHVDHNAAMRVALFMAALGI